MAGEFDLIANYFDWPVAESDNVKLSVGDDAAVLALRPNHELVVSVDTLVAGVHYPLDTLPFDIGYKSLIVNLSDIAAMGAEPCWFTLALTLPANDQAWLAEFSSGLKQAAKEYSVQLVGGDTTRGSSTISIQIMGEVLTGRALKRSTAKLGDRLYITNTLGDAAAGLAIYQAASAEDRQKNLSNDERYCVSRLNRPTARIVESRIIRQHATACMDISDGLLQDLSHILKASQLGAVINTDTLMCSASLAHLYNREECLKFALTGGDDYELLFSIPRNHQDQFIAEMQRCDLAFQCIGELTADVGTIRDTSGKSLSVSGFQHF